MENKPVTFKPGRTNSRNLISAIEFKATHFNSWYCDCCTMRIVLTPAFISNEQALIDTFGLPKTGYSRKDFYSASFFLRSGAGAWITRFIGPNAANAVATADGNANVIGKEVFIPNEDYFYNTYVNGAAKIGETIQGVTTPATPARGGQVTYTLPSIIRINDKVKFTVDGFTEQTLTVVNERTVDQLISAINYNKNLNVQVVASKTMTGQLVLTAKNIALNIVGTYTTDVASEVNGVTTAPTPAVAAYATYTVPATIQAGDVVKFTLIW